MKIEKVSDNVIKVTISLNDLKERNLDLSSLNYNSPAAQELFWDMMEQAEVEFGFTVSDSQLLIEPTPDSKDGFIVTITKIEEDGDFESIHKYIKNRYKKSDVRVKKKGRRILSAVLIYCFSNFEDLCALSKQVKSCYTGESTLYRYKSAYYLVMTRNSFTGTNPKALDTLLNEYGNKVVNVTFYEGFLDEYGTKIAEYNAIEVLNNYF